MSINIAIDGPAGAGKSTIARRAAKELGFIYVDTGALYRTVGVGAMRKNADTKSASQVAPLLDEMKIELKFVDGEQVVLLNGEDVRVAIRTPEASMAASDVSAIPEVRAFLFELQRSIARENNCIMDGRDIGTVVLPEAQIKIFLTASAEERARRRYKELCEKGIESDYETVLKEMIQRDYNDSHRAIAPLKAADDAIIVDTSDINLEQSIEKLTGIIKERL
ncbi:MAG: (d)CMP kinase [Clostridiales bacterium]|nr:(d)CMP kinase [Clostridiales bacterium]